MIGTKYHKIQSIYKRDMKTHRFTDEFSCPEFELLRDIDWDWSEKIDGTNIRITFGLTIQDLRRPRHTEPIRLIGGRTDRAQIPAHLIARLEELFPISKMADAFDTPRVEEQTVVLFGEGIGPKIQKGGGRYSKVPDFVLFDVRVGRWWLTRESVQNIADGFNISMAPRIGEGSLREAILKVRDGFFSKVADDPTLPAEGLVLRSKCELFMRNGGRIITKVKTKDFS